MNSAILSSPLLSTVPRFVTTTPFPVTVGRDHSKSDDSSAFRDHDPSHPCDCWHFWTDPPHPGDCWRIQLNYKGFRPFPVQNISHSLPLPRFREVFCDKKVRMVCPCHDIALSTNSTAATTS